MTGSPNGRRRSRSVRRVEVSIMLLSHTRLTTRVAVSPEDGECGAKSLVA